MSGLIAHRGRTPRASVDGPVALANRRLAIIDPRRAATPLQRGRLGGDRLQRGAVQLPVPAPELVSRGHRFRSATDTEVIVHAYEEYGRTACATSTGCSPSPCGTGGGHPLPRPRPLRGQAPLLRLDRRRPGHRLRGEGLLRPARLPGGPDPEALVEYFTFQNVLSDRTLFRACSLPPGSTMTVGPEGRARIERYWQFQFAPRRTGGAYYADGVRERFEEAVRRHDERRPPGQLPLRRMDLRLHLRRRQPPDPAPAHLHRGLQHRRRRRRRGPQRRTRRRRAWP